jgi:hypothetical protein
MLRDGVEVRMLGSTVDGHLNPTLSTPFVKTASGRPGRWNILKPKTETLGPAGISSC